MVFTCVFCNRDFDANNGLKIHLSQCDLKRTQVNTEIPIERRDNIEVFLPPYQPNNNYPNTEWHNISRKEFVDFINRHMITLFTGEKIYSNFLAVKQVVYLSMNLPSG